MSLGITAIAKVRSTRADAVDDDWDRETAIIELEPRFGPEALFGLDAFSHAEIAFVFDQVPDSKIETGARHPRNREDWPLVGIFAQRGKSRPNRIGITVCRIEQVEGTRLHVRGLDAIHGTPVIDIKPVMREFLPRGEIRQPAWATELMADYWTREG
ncbi:MAG: tsaA [Sphingomonas bacterium]|jgi:tRNA-Thr(GGU) m(6)t(6)A37 methyltransferase TsaA|uniref:SAM-dependent methyltransferase n=1 Tax=Sphingomonas bacterium TaxID=1895847 RepID=UPI002612FEA7|nr:SAM-dependent methyltransferase [Sphingomonas bacterium]MDB5705365.1 tsaA [Sphingomonas bacterium]